MTLTKDIASKLAVAFVAVAMAFTFVAPVAQATDVEDMTVEEMQALINELLAKLGGSSSSSSSCDYTFTTPMGSGASGAGVMELQKFLNSDAETRVAASGVGSPGQETQYYGSLTAAAVSKFQTKYRSEVLTPLGLVSATGYFGNSSIAKANALCASDSMSDDSDDSDDSSDDEIDGGAGSVDTWDTISSLSNEEVGEDEEDVEVAGLEVEVSEDSDIMIRAVKIAFVNQNTVSGSDDDFDKYASEVSIWVDGEEYARLDADEFDDDNSYTKTVSLDSGAIIDAGDTGEIVVAVSGVSNLDSGNATEEWTIDFPSVRFEDGQGSIISEDPAQTAETFSFENYATAADIEFKVSKGDDDINDARSIEVSSTSETSNVEILSFEIEIEGDSDINVDDIPVDFTAVGAGVSQIANAFELVVDGEVIATESTSSSADTSATIVFDDIDWDIEAGDTVEVIVRVDLNEMTGANFTAGDTLSADVNPDDSGWDIEDENGDDLGSGDKTGSATSDAHTFYADGIQVVENSTTITEYPGDNDDDDYVKLVIKFDVTAYGETAYIQNAIDVTTGATTSSTTPTNAVGVHVQSADTDLNSSHVQATLSSTADEETNSFEVQEGDTETFTLTVTVANASSSDLDNSSVRSILAGVGFADTDSGTSDQMFTSNVGDIKTDYATIIN